MADAKHTPPDWLTEGAPVVLWNTMRFNTTDPQAVVTTVKKVSGSSFSVHGEDTRIYFLGMRSTTRGSSWDRYHRVADTPESEQAQQALAKTSRAQLHRTATRAVDAWQGNDDPDTLRAALFALISLAKADGITPASVTESESA